jgi:dTDP-4-amino-4,6-dideoxygalactose transaminase
MKLCNQFIINASDELVMRYSISPVTKQDVMQNRIITQSAVNEGRNYFEQRFNDYILTYGGRSALNIALSTFDLKPTDVVTILTTSSNFYISGCVTTAIEKFCKWSREIEPDTKIILVNHEFGFVYKDIDSLKKYKLPVIEDCAHSFFSQNQEETIGTIGDFVIYSLPKMFPIQFGGVLVSNKMSLKKVLNQNEENYILSCVGRNVENVEQIKQKRLENYFYLINKLNALGFTPTFDVSNKEIPGVCLFDINQEINLPELKIHCQRNGIESSVFYGKNAFFIPVHQNLEIVDLDYFVTLIQYFIQ